MPLVGSISIENGFNRHHRPLPDPSVHLLFLHCPIQLPSHTANREWAQSPDEGMHARNVCVRTIVINWNTGHQQKKTCLQLPYNALLCLTGSVRHNKAL